MAEKSIDRLLSVTDSKYRLSVVVAKRAMQLKAGVPAIVPPEQRATTHNLVTLAMREVATGKLEWGDRLVDEDKLEGYLDRTRSEHHERLAQQNSANYPVPDFDRD